METNLLKKITILFMGLLIAFSVPAKDNYKTIKVIDTEVLYQWKDLVPTYEERITRIDGIHMDGVTCESADAVYELKGNAKLPVKNVSIENVQVSKVKKFVRKSDHVENVVEKNITYQMINE